MKILISEIEDAFNKLITGLKEESNDNEELNIEEDYYWSIDKEQLYRLDSKPSNFTVGSLSDDIQEIKKLNKGEYYPVKLCVNKLITILQYIANS